MYIYATSTSHFLVMWDIILTCKPQQIFHIYLWVIISSSYEQTVLFLLATYAPLGQHSTTMRLLVSRLSTMHQLLHSILAASAPLGLTLNLASPMCSGWLSAPPSLSLALNHRLSQCTTFLRFFEIPHYHTRHTLVEHLALIPICCDLDVKYPNHIHNEIRSK